VNLQNDPGFFFGAGLMGVAAGLGLGGKSPNKWALILGLGALWRANTLHPLVDISPREEFYEQLPDLPSMPSVQDVRSKVGLTTPAGFTSSGGQDPYGRF
jgi:hypothetical protein